MALLLTASAAAAQTGSVAGTVRDETGGVLPGASVELRGGSGAARVTVTGAWGDYRFEGVAPGPYRVVFSLLNFGGSRRDTRVTDRVSARVDVVLHLALSAEITVTGHRTFANLADVEDPAANLVGVAQSASQGAITARQLDPRPLMRAGEVLETVPGVIISQHSGEGKANQYYL